MTLDMGMIKALIIDDEQFARENLKMLVEEYCQEIEIIGLAGGAKEAKEKIADLNPDLIFLDIMMPGEDGFSLLQSLKERTFSVIFTTAHNEHALRAFKHNAIDYLEKPIDIDDLVRATDKAKDFINLKKHTNISDERLTGILNNLVLNNSLEKTSIPTRDGLAIVKNSEIIHLEASESYTTIYLTNNRKYVSSKTIKSYEDKLNGEMFFRVHKSHIINFSHHLLEFNRSAGNMAIMSNAAEIPISRRKLPIFLDRIACL